MILREFLRNNTRTRELCVIRDSGYKIATCWIDYEDLFMIPERLIDKEVLGFEWGHIDICDEYGFITQAKCRYIDIKEN